MNVFNIRSIHRKAWGIGAFTLMLLSGMLSEGNALNLRKVTPDEAAPAIEKWMVLDGRPHQNWQGGHIPGAMVFSWEDLTRTDSGGIKYRTFPPDELAGILGNMGISEKSPVLVYGDADSSWGGEGWVVWVLSWLGHQGPVCFLDGGIQAWQATGNAITTEPAANRPKTVYQVHINPEAACTANELVARRNKITLIDTRGYFTEWIPGHLPNAIHIPWEKFYSGKNRSPLSSEALKNLLVKHGVNPEKPVVYYCTGGIRSGFAWLVHELSDLPPAVNFEGGTEEWKQNQPLVR